MSKRIYQRQLPVFIVSFFMTILLVNYYAVEIPVLKSISSEFLAWGAMIALIQMAFGYMSLMRMHIQRISRIGKEKFDRRSFKSIVVMGTFVVFILLGLIGGQGEASTGFQYWYGAIVAMAGLWPVLEWVSHYYSPMKMFKVVNIETAVMVAVWVLACLREMPAVVVFFPWAETIGDWIMRVPFTAANRGVMITAGIGVVVLAVRALIGREPGLVEQEIVE